MALSDENSSANVVTSLAVSWYSFAVALHATIHIFFIMTMLGEKTGQKLKTCSKNFN